MTPRARLTLEWPTFTAAADQAGMSRRYCGIHFKDGDLFGRETGRKVAGGSGKRHRLYSKGKVPHNRTEVGGK